jgi:hypothetical protein
MPRMRTGRFDVNEDVILLKSLLAPSLAKCAFVFRNLWLSIS